MKYIIPKSILTTTDKGEYILLNTKNGKFFGLDVMGTYVWDLIKRGDSKKAIIDNIVQTYNVSREVAEKDIRELLIELSKHELVIVDE
ncbi:PqqD family protein [Lederbergia sp. NSJ-179]|uniref:PqqD family protein n=1 Tax=Lederbergia sp. NSJ-179 TaxID=2931402 RepID=UPI001FD04E8E|nr:PqqD family protein [Lederbergia sp. NSJ-179]MCJ7841916.1 PqqD family protein [Lederbergia sp. NSJ-179]